MRVLRKVRRALRESHAFDGVRRILVATSGGVDSVVLLHMVCALRDRGGPEVVAAHVHHGIRGEEADRDCEFAEIVARRFLCDFHVLHARPALDERSEAGLRSLRFSLLDRLAGSLRAKRVLLGHNRDDQVETVFLRLMGGSGVRGLAGMRTFRRPIWVRPMLDVSRAEILLDAGECGIPFVTDSSNRDEKYRRNFIRHSVLPMLRRSVNPRLDEHLADLARCFGDVRRMLEEASASVLNSARVDPHSYRTPVLCNEGRAVRRAALQAAYEVFAGVGASLNRRHLVVLDGLIARRDDMKIVALPRGVRAVRDRDILRFSRND